MWEGVTWVVCLGVYRVFFLFKKSHSYSNARLETHPFRGHKRAVALAILPCVLEEATAPLACGLVAVCREGVLPACFSSGAVVRVVWPVKFFFLNNTLGLSGVAFYF